jgi:4-diphosphocytidyl-2-C-methyl-D-erythritol kinase
MASFETPAKLNLFLTILAQEASGFHQLETVFAVVDLTDRIELELAGRGIDLEVVGADLGDPRKNLVYQAAELLMLRAGRDEGVSIRLEKRIPHGAGLGGGSSDAAATLALLNRELGDPLGSDELRGLAAGLGADVPFFLAPSPVSLGWGRGDRLLPLESLEGLSVVLVLPDVHVSTQWAYRELAEHRARRGGGWRGPAILSEVRSGPPADRVRAMCSRGNDFESVVFAAHPELAGIRDQLEDLGAVGARMSGSGSALFAVFEDEGQARDAARAVEVMHPSTRCHSGHFARELPGTL